MLTPGAVMWNPTIDFRPTENDWFNDVAVQADGKIVAVGQAGAGGSRDFLVARFTAGGALDLSFGGGDGWLTYDFGGGRGDAAGSVAVQADGRIVVGGFTFEPATGFSMGLIRLNIDGTLDATFGASGRVIEDYANGDSDVSAVTQASDGGLIVTGSKLDGSGGSAYGTVYKFDAAGAKDPGFNGGGFRDLTSHRTVNDFAVDAAGRIVLAINGGDVIRLTPAGAFDTDFSGDGVMSIAYDVGTGPTANGVAVMLDGRIVVAGYSFDGTYFVPGVVRLNDDGSYDAAFGGDGRYSFDPTPSVSDFIRDVAVLPDGGVVVAGHDARTNGDVFVAVLTPAGALDAAYSVDGIAAASFGTSNDFGHSLAVTPAGRYVIAGLADRFGGGETDRPGIAQFEGRLPRRDDLLGFTDSGDWWNAASTGAAFTTTYFGAWDASLGWKYVSSGDFDGDGGGDVAGRDSSGRWMVGLNDGASFTTSEWSAWVEGAGWRDERFADFNGDGRSDVAGRAASGNWWVMLSTGTGFTTPALWAAWSEPAGWPSVVTADFDGDGRADIAGRTSTGQWWVSRSTGSAFATTAWGGWSDVVWSDVLVGDFDGDGRSDITGRGPSGEWWVARSTGTGFTNQLFTAWSDAGWRDVAVGDFDGDGRSDIAGRASTGQWWVARSTGTGFTNLAWGAWDEGASWRDVRVGDFDGDGKSDVAGRTGGGQWWVSRSTGTGLANSAWAGWSEPAGWTTFRDEFEPTLA